MDDNSKEHVLPKATAVAAGYHAHLCPNCCHRWVHPHRDMDEMREDGLGFEAARALIAIARQKSSREAHTCPKCHKAKSWYWDNEKNRKVGASFCGANQPTGEQEAILEITQLLSLIGGY